MLWKWNWKKNYNTWKHEKKVKKKNENDDDDWNVTKKSHNNEKFSSMSKCLMYWSK